MSFDDAPYEEVHEAVALLVELVGRPDRGGTKPSRIRRRGAVAGPAPVVSETTPEAAPLVPPMPAAVAEPLVDEPVVPEPVVAEPLVDEPRPTEPPPAEPLVDEPEAGEPLVDEPVVPESVAPEPVVAEPEAAPTPEPEVALELEIAPEPSPFATRDTRETPVVDLQPEATTEAQQSVASEAQQSVASDNLAQDATPAATPNPAPDEAPESSPPAEDSFADLAQEPISTDRITAEMATTDLDDVTRELPMPGYEPIEPSPPSPPAVPAPMTSAPIALPIEDDDDDWPETDLDETAAGWTREKRPAPDASQASPATEPGHADLPPETTKNFFQSRIGAQRKDDPTS